MSGMNTCPCGEVYDKGTGCEHDGRELGPCCLTQCPECRQAIKDDHLADIARDGWADW